MSAPVGFVAAMHQQVEVAELVGRNLPTHCCLRKRQAVSL